MVYNHTNNENNLIEIKNKNVENALLVFVRIKRRQDHLKENSDKEIRTEDEIHELKNLARSAGATVKDLITHNQQDPNPKYFISTGKLEEIKIIVEKDEIDLVIFDNDLTSTQQSNLQSKLDSKIIDRTALILDIFAQRAQSREGKLQVELAQLNYLLPRLRGKGLQLSRLGGGIGTRGPGEQKLEVDRRKIRKRISQLEEKISQISIQRDTQRKQREENNVFMVSIVGYTNSGKSSLLNSLTQSDVFVKDMLFSTLDSTTRKLRYYKRGEILITDTVGFIEKLPHQLIASFKSTLEEVRKADLLLLMVDISNANFENQIASVRKVLKEIEVMDKPIILVFNKIDLIDKKTIQKIKLKHRGAIFVSVICQVGFKELYEKITKVLDKNLLRISVKLPYSESKLIAFIHDNCEIIKSKYLGDSVVFLLNINPRLASRFSQFIYKEKKIARRNEKIPKKNRTKNIS